MKATTPKGREVEVYSDGQQDRVSVYYIEVLVVRQEQGLTSALSKADECIDKCNLRK